MIDFFVLFFSQLQQPALGFLLAGMVMAAVGSRFRIPDQIYSFCVYMLLMAIGLKAGIAVREANLLEILVPAVFCVFIGVGVVLLGSITLARLPGVKRDDALATLGLFGAVSGTTLAVAMAFLNEANIFFEPWILALYPFMDIPALITAIVLAGLYLKKGSQGADVGKGAQIKAIILDSLKGMALSCLIVGVLLGLFVRVEGVLDAFYAPLFKGFLSILMLILGREAYLRFRELSKVGHWFVLYATVAPFVHGLVGFGLGYVAHILVGLSPGGAVLLGVIAASNSDISGPPTIRAGIPSANPSAYIGASSGIGTPIALALVIPLLVTLSGIVFPS